MSSVTQDAFWTAEDKLPISQKSISIPSSNGLDYNGGQRVTIEVPSTVEFIQPKESYLQFDVKLQLPTGIANPTYLQLDETLGAQILLKDVRIYSGGAGKILLEEYQDYNVLTSVKYSYETNDVIRAKRALTEGSTCHSIKTRGNTGTTESHMNEVVNNPYFENVSANAAGDVFDDANLSKQILELQQEAARNRAREVEVGTPKVKVYQGGKLKGTGPSTSIPMHRILTLEQAREIAEAEALTLDSKSLDAVLRQYGYEAVLQGSDRVRILGDK